MLRFVARQHRHNRCPATENRRVAYSRTRRHGRADNRYKLSAVQEGVVALRRQSCTRPFGGGRRCDKITHIQPSSLCAERRICVKIRLFAPSTYFSPPCPISYANYTYSPQFATNKIWVQGFRLLDMNFVLRNFADEKYSCATTPKKEYNVLAFPMIVFYFCSEHIEYGSVTLFSCDERRKFQAQ